jgi:GntR family transcriptional repressor for pyruvate dehydrogenase complex
MSVRSTSQVSNIMRLSPDESSSAQGSQTLTQKAFLAITNYIRDEKLKVGDRLPSEKHFAELLGVSRAVMREAFGALSALRLIDVGNGRVPRVKAMDGSALATSLDHAVNTAQITVQQVWDVRRTIELRTVVLAAQNRTDAEAEKIMDHAKAMRKHRKDFLVMAQHDFALHHAIAEASHNILFVQVVSSFSDLMMASLPVAWNTRNTAKERTVVLQRHEAIAEAIANKDPEAARLAMDEHFDGSVQNLLNAGIK